MAGRSPKGRVGVVEGAVSDKTHDWLFGSAKFRSDSRTHAVAFRASGGSNVFVITSISGVFKNVLRNGKLLDGYQASAKSFEGLVQGVGEYVRTYLARLLDDRSSGVTPPGAE